MQKDGLGLTKKYETPFGMVEQPLPGIKNIAIQNERKLKLDRLPPGLTFIKSPKGTGKTTSLPTLFAPLIKHSVDENMSLLEWLELNEDPDGRPIDASLDTGFSILLIGHRQALIREMCQRLNLRCYLDDNDRDGNPIAGKMDRQLRYGICLDSITKLLRRSYDLVIIDESEQVLSHFFSDTMRERRIGHFRFFQSLLKASKRICCLDADLGWITFDTITHLAGATSASKTEAGMEMLAKMEQKKLPRGEQKTSPSVRVYINQYIETGQTIKYYIGQSSLVAELINEVRSGKRVYVASNCKNKIKALGKVCITPATARVDA